MADPTFTKQFGLAVQADILRQAAIDRQHRQARALQQDDSPAWRVAARRLAVMVRAPFSGRSRQAATAATCRSGRWPANLLDDR